MLPLKLNERKGMANHRPKPGARLTVERVRRRKGSMNIAGWALCTFYEMRKQWPTLERAPWC